MKHILIKIIENSKFIRKLYLHLFNDVVIDKSCLFPGYYFRNNTYMIEKGSCSIFYGMNTKIHGVKIICHGVGNKIFLEDFLEFTDYGKNNTIYIDGNNNEIYIGTNSVLSYCSFFIKGNSNRVEISSNCSCMMVDFHMEQNNNCINIGNCTTMHGRKDNHVIFELDEGKAIVLDEDCMISNGTTFRNSDSHSLLDLKGNRLNNAKDVYIRKHCWIDLRSLILKGTVIPKNTIIGVGSLCNKTYIEENTVITGNPAKVVKTNVIWDRKLML